ncbi:MAG TPA: hypothetical protein VGL81_29680 [Polyangiaceae bacterium]|jgi:alpha-tubulin suppressor-like RCC1 family protein
MRVWGSLFGVFAWVFLALLAPGCASEATPSVGETVSTTSSAVCTTAGLASDQGSSGPTGTLVTWTASAGCAAQDIPTYSFYELAPGGSWQQVQGWTTTATFAFDTTGATAGTYAFQVWIRAQGSSAPYESYAGASFTVTSAGGGGACTGATLSPSLASPQPTGTSVTLTAGSSTCSNPEYAFYELAPGGSWQQVQGYSSTATYAFNGATAGAYSFEVWVRDASSTGSYDVYAGLSYTLGSSGSAACTGATLSPSVASPQQTGTSVTLTAGSSSCAHPQYAFYELSPGGSWQLVQGYSNTATYPFNSATAGAYSFEVWVRDASSSAPYDTYTGLSYTLSSGSAACTGATLSPSLASPQPTGTAVTLTAGSSTCSNPQYAFYEQLPGGSWQQVQGYSSTATFAFNGATAGAYSFQVWVRDASSIARYDTYTGLSYTLGSSGSQPCTGATLSPSLASPQPAGTPVTLVAGSSSCANPQYAFYELAPGGSWQPVQAYGAASTFAFTNTTPGTYRFQAWVRDASSGASYDTYAGLGYTLVVTASAVAEGEFHSCALMADGSVQCWGDNSDGELGNGTTTNSSTPVAVSGLSGATAIAASVYDTCALVSNGTVECWGDNQYGELGDGTSTNSSTPVAVSGLSGVVAIAAGSFNTCALLSDGTVECWGLASLGGLGDGTTSGPDACGGYPCSTTPVAVSNLTGVKAIAAGNGHACALLSDGTVQCWGYNFYGELGNGTSTNPTTPVAVSALSGATAIAAGGYETCALVSGGTVECWGSNPHGELGSGAIGSDSCGGSPCSTTPQVVAGLSGVTAVGVGNSSAGPEYACALLSNGTVECWGDNYDGELGNGTTTTSTSPVPVSELTGVTAVSVGGYQTCAIRPGASEECWGFNGDGELGDGTTTSSTTPVAAAEACTPGPCTVTAPSNGTLGTCQVSLASGTSCQVACNSGFQVSGAATSCVNGTLTSTQTCGSDSCTVTAPSNGTLGTCPGSLASGTNCQLACNTGFQLTGAATSCAYGDLTAQTCGADSCTVTAPTNATLGTCPSTLTSGSSCQIQCNSGYTSTGTATSCLDGSLTEQVCTPSPCTVTAPANGTLGNCPSVLATDATCQFTCNPGYTLTGASTTCHYGILESQTCTP